MGITLKTVSVKWDPETVRMSDELQAQFAPFVEGRSQLTRLAIKKLYADVSTHGTLAVIGECLQVLPSISSRPQAEPLQPAKIPSSFYPKFAFKTGVIQ